MKPAPKPPKRVKVRKPPKPRKPIRWRPPAAAVKDIAQQRERVATRQRNELGLPKVGCLESNDWVPCAGCRRAFPRSRLDLSHIIALGRVSTRYKRDHPMNVDANVELRCRPCHLEWEASRVWLNAQERQKLADMLNRALTGKETR